MSCKFDIRPEIEERAREGSPPTEEILPLEIADAMDSSIDQLISEMPAFPFYKIFLQNSSIDKILFESASSFHSSDNHLCLTP